MKVRGGWEKKYDGEAGNATTEGLYRAEMSD